MTYDNLQDYDSNDAKSQRNGASCRPHGARLYNFVQGFRRSLDVHLKSYYKIDNAFSSTLRLSHASDKLQALSRGLTDTGLIDFCCVYLVHPVRGTFGTVALSGAGAELFPPLLSEGEQAGRVNFGRDGEHGSGRLLPNIFTRCVFQVQDSNWSVEDVVTSRAPWYYDCTAATNGFGLPTDGGWLRRVGMRSVLALPAMGPGGEVTGVLVVATKQKTLDHLLLRKLEDLCYKLTPVVGAAGEEHFHLLANRRLAAPYESIADFAHEVLGELLNLDRAVAISACNNGSVHGATTGVNPSQQRQHQRQASIAAAATATTCAKGRKSSKSDTGHFDAAAAVAAATAAGFTWTGAPPAPVSVRSTFTQPKAQPAQLGAHNNAQRLQGSQGLSPFAQNQPPLQHQHQHQETNSTFRTALTGAVTQPISSFALLSSTANLVTPPLASSDDENAILLPTEPDLRQVELIQRSCPCPAAAPVHMQCPQSRSPQTAPGVSSANSLPAPCTVVGQGNPMTELLRGPPAASTADRAASRSTRSLSCLEFSGGAVANDVRDALGESGGVTAIEVQEALAGQEAIPSVWTASVITATSCSPSSGSPSKEGLGADLWRRQVPATAARQQQKESRPDDDASAAYLQGVHRVGCISAAAGVAHSSAASSTRSSGSREALYMMESSAAGELAPLPFCTGYMVSPGSSSPTMDGGAIQRGAPLESSFGVATGPMAIGGSTGDASTPQSGNRSGANLSVVWRLAAARGSSCATDASVPADTQTTFNGTVTAGCTNNLWRVSSPMTPIVSAPAWNSDSGHAHPEFMVRDLTESRWSRDSAAAAAAVWSNEAAEAFAAAMRFTAAAKGGAGVSGPSTRTAPRSCSGAAAGSQQPGAEGLHGGLYDIIESGPVPSRASSIESFIEDEEEDWSVELTEWSGGGVGEAGGAFLLSSGLGAEALERCKQQH